MSAKAENIKKQLQVYRAELAKYKQLFMEDGSIDDVEQAQLDSMTAVIDQCEQKLNSEKNAGSETNGDEAKQFKSQVTNIKPKLAQIKNLEAKIKGGKVTFDDFDLADEIEEALESIISFFESLPQMVKDAMQSVYDQLKKALAKIKKVSNELMTADSDEPEIKANQLAIENISKILEKYI